MIDTVLIMFAGIAGLFLGAVFFGGLWWTVRKALASTGPAWWFLGSFLLRIGIVVTGFFLVSAGNWQRLVACLLGFVVARLVVTRLTKPPLTNQPLANQPLANQPLAMLKTTHAP